VNRSGLGPLTPGTMYPRAVFQRLSGWAAGAFRQARLAGMPVLYLHGRSFIFADDAIAYIRNAAKTEKDAPAKARADA